MLRLTPLAEIVSLEGSYWSRLNKINIEKALARLPNKLPGLNDKPTFLDRIKVEPPANYSSHHSIANEWSLLRWSDYIGATGKDLKKVKQRLESLLYYKYLTSLYGTPTLPDKNKFCIQDKGKILLIDDEGRLGWGSYYKSFFSLSPNVQFSEWEYDYKKKQRQEILKNFSTYFNENTADVVLLDLRLCDEDFNESTAPDKLTGCEILQIIKDINKGIQVVIITASDKAWNMKLLKDKGADAYFIKESPVNSISDEFSKTNFKLYLEDIKEALKRIYLKGLFTKLKNIQARLEELKVGSTYTIDFLEQVEKQIEIAYSMHYKARSEKDFAFAYVTLYMILELTNKELVSSEGIDDNKFWRVGDQYLKNWVYNTGSNNYEAEENSIVTGNKPPEWKKLAGIWFQVLREVDHDFIKNVYFSIKKRNDFIHNEPNLNQDIFNKNGFIELFNLVAKLIFKL